ncbi:YrhK family protein [Stakelama saccharophila]|uniref:YrhK family protein n=1 Tax=Stakelama saccharophila TaxID=3075605 RepID=A0ABZ0B965_9SPHN|nr:YrhK family protein [Stakelama sp. W311]WNO53823.1 YrhK family protein [Stakelama sp. W311]
MLKTLVRDYPYIHLALGLVGNACFLIGSVLFFKRFEELHHLAVWLFVIGSAGMLIGAMGKAATDVIDARERRRNNASGG